MTQNQQEIGPRVVHTAQALGDVLSSILVLLLSILESIFRTIVQKAPKSVKGEIVLITGTGHGMGRELALLYAQEGATVVGWDINEANAAETTKAIEKLGHKAHHFACDVSNRENVLQLAELVRQQVGDVTILINNAGIMPAHPFLEHTPEEIEKIMKINVMAHFWTLEAFLPAMKQHNYGHIVSMSSMAGLMGIVNLVPYCCSKFAVRGLMEALNEELRQNKQNQIQITSIHPFMVNTGLCKKPVLKYENLLPIVDQKEAAKEIMRAQRTDMNEVSIPRFVGHLNNVGRVLPRRGVQYIIDTLGIGLESDLS